MQGDGRAATRAGPGSELHDPLHQLDHTLESLEELIEHLNAEVQKRLHPFDAAIDRLDTIPGVVGERPRFWWPRSGWT
jgi:hypothetical protein